MAHYNDHRGSKVSVRRAPPIVRRGEGSLHPDVEQDRSLIKRTVKKSTLRYPRMTGGAISSEEAAAAKKPKRKKPRLQMTGGAVRARLDRRSRGGKIQDHDPRANGDQNALEQEATREKRAERTMARARGGQIMQRTGKDYSELAPQHHERGGRTKKGHTTVSVMIAPQRGQHPMAVPVPAAGPPPAAAMPAPQRPPMMQAPGVPPMAGAPPMMAAPGMPPPIRQRGGRTYASGGTDGPAWKEGLRNGTQISHSPSKSDLKDIGRPLAVTRRRGGAVNEYDRVASRGRVRVKHG
jgi:hypothetical protein